MSAKEGIRKSLIVSLFLLLASQVLGDPSFPKLFRSADQRLTIKIVSPDHLELTLDTRRTLCSYTRFDDSLLRVVAASLGSVEAYVFKMTAEGLVSTDGIILYDEHHFPPAPKPSKLSEGAISAPRPEYPYEARRRKIVGAGVVLISVGPTGEVTDARMSPTTGSAILDNAAMSAFRRWRFKPGTQSPVRMPITFNASGVQY